MGSLAAEIRGHGCELVGVAVTATYSQMAFARELAVDFPLLSDWDGQVCGAYGVRYDEWKGHTGLAKRALFVNDAGGTITYAWHTDDAETLPDLEPMMEAVAAL